MWPSWWLLLASLLLAQLSTAYKIEHGLTNQSTPLRIGSNGTHNNQQADSESSSSPKFEGFPGTCTFSVDGEVSDKVMLANTSQETTVEVFAFGNCTLLIVGVGGGGKGGKGEADGYGGGGGSGYVEWHYLSLFDESMTLNVHVGGPGGATTVRDVHSCAECILLTAAKGHDGGVNAGGGGYSGGGGWGYESGAPDAPPPGGKGGTDGGDGHSGKGQNNAGRGSQVKVDEIPTNGFAILPAGGGSSQSRAGGGGGGILVDGDGYGGGGRGGGSSGRQGVVLIMNITAPAPTTPAPTTTTTTTTPAPTTTTSSLPVGTCEDIHINSQCDWDYGLITSFQLTSEMFTGSLCQHRCRNVNGAMFFSSYGEAENHWAQHGYCGCFSSCASPATGQCRDRWTCPEPRGPARPCLEAPDTCRWCHCMRGGLYPDADSCDLVP